MVNRKRPADERWRFTILPRLGIRPSLSEVLRATMDDVVARAGSRPQPGERDPGRLALLDAGCGGSSFVRRYRPRIDHLVGVDIHPPAGSLRHLDAFVQADMCRDADALPPASFDIVISKFTVEHLGDPPAAFVNMRRWLRPGGSVVLVTVNRRHPLVAAYLDLPSSLQARLQRRVKASAHDAHPLVGACNAPGSLRTALADAGFEAIELRYVSHLARAWGRWPPGYLLGLAGDLVAQRFPSRRSTLVATARVPAT